MQVGLREDSLASHTRTPAWGHVIRRNTGHPQQGGSVPELMFGQRLLHFQSYKELSGQGECIPDTLGTSGRAPKSQL